MKTRKLISTQTTWISAWVLLCSMSTRAIAAPSPTEVLSNVESEINSQVIPGDDSVENSENKDESQDSGLDGLTEEQRRNRALFQTLPMPVNPSDIFQKVYGYFIKLTGRSLLSDSGDIDRMIGDPRELNESTSNKLKSLPPRLRLMLYGTIVDKLGTVNYTPNPNHGGIPYGAGDRNNMSLGRVRYSPNTVPGTSASNSNINNGGYVVNLDSGATDQFVNSVENALSSHFSTEEMMDLGVFLLSKTPVFPRSDALWNQIKNLVVKYDIWMALAFVVVMLATDQGELPLEKVFLDIPEENIRVAFFGFISNLGVSMKPTLRAGVKARIKGLEMNGQWTERVNVGKDSERRIVEASVREHWLQYFSQKFGWEVNASANGRYVWLHNKKEDEGRISANGDLYFRKNGLFGNPHVSFSGGSNISSDFNTGVGGGTSVSIEDTNRDWAFTLRASGGTHRDINPVTKIGGQFKSDARIGMVMGGNFGEDKAAGFISDLRVRRRQIVNSLNDRKRVEQQLQQLEARFDFLSGGPSSIEQEAQSLKMLRTHYTNAIHRLDENLQAYEEKLWELYEFEGKKNDSKFNAGCSFVNRKLTQDCPYVDWELMQEVRMALRS